MGGGDHTGNGTPGDVGLRGQLTTGMTVTDLRFLAPEECRASAAVELDRERFWGLMVDALERIGEVNDEPSPTARGVPGDSLAP